MMYNTIKNFNKQFDYKPRIENAPKLKKTSKFLVAGMGGSHLAADILKMRDGALDIIIHSDYGLPFIPNENPRDRLVILSSYSGDTEETISAFSEAGARNLPRAVVSVGGKLVKLAKKNSVPFIQLPEAKIQPRLALGFSLTALLKLTKTKNHQMEKEARELSSKLNPPVFEKRGAKLAKKLVGFIPIIYSSSKNFPIAYNWKIKFNETSKIPAFCNSFPELNHNEMAGFDVKNSTRNLSKNFYFLLIEDENDPPKIKKRAKTLKKLYGDLKFPVESIKLASYGSYFYKIFASLILADWVSFNIAKEYGVDPEQIPMVEKFKKLIA